MHIIKLHEVIDDPLSKKVYLVMDYLQGGTLAELLEESDSGLPLEKVRVYFKGLLSAMHYCHEVKKIAHRDIKPQNILLDSDGRAKLCDFGFARNLGLNTFVLTSIKVETLFWNLIKYQLAPRAPHSTWPRS